MSAAMLEINDLHVSYGQVDAVRGVSLSLAHGQIVSVIGPNGAGKSTMFNLLTCTLPMTSGQVRFLDHDIAGMPQRQVARLGLARTFQHVKLRPHMSLLDNVALGAHSRTSWPAACRWARSASWRSPARWPPTRCCWCSTSPRRASAARKRWRLATCCASCVRRA